MSAQRQQHQRQRKTLLYIDNRTYNGCSGRGAQVGQAYFVHDICHYIGPRSCTTALELKTDTVQ